LFILIIDVGGSTTCFCVAGTGCVTAGTNGPSLDPLSWHDKIVAPKATTANAAKICLVTVISAPTSRKNQKIQTVYRPRNAPLATISTPHHSLIIDHWSLVIGHWSLINDHWSLVIGHWSLIIDHSSFPLTPSKSSPTPR
jgi:hypothetical protein